MEIAVRKLLLDLYPVLQKIPKDLLDEALKTSSIKKAPVGMMLWDETMVADCFPFLLKGRARIYKLSPQGRELHLYSVSPGEGCIIAMNSLVGKIQSNARAVVDEDSETLILDMTGYKLLISQSEAFRDYVFSDLATGMAQLTELATSMAFQKLDQRLASTLVSKVNPIKTTHQALADELGSVREIISRLLKNFEDRGWVSLQRGQISIVNPQKLIEFADQA